MTLTSLLVMKPCIMFHLVPGSRAPHPRNAITTQDPWQFPEQSGVAKCQEISSQVDAIAKSKEEGSWI